MNLFFKLFIILLLSNQLQARELFIISYRSENRPLAYRISKMLQRDHGIPEQVIEMQSHHDPCRPQLKSILHICINKKKEYQIIFKNSDILHRSFSHFKESTKKPFTQKGLNYEKRK
jgi:hypothetical protein